MIDAPAPAAPLPAPGAGLDVPLRWLIRLRWGAAAGELITILAVHLLIESQPPVLPHLTPLLALVALTAASNAALAGWVRARRGPPPAVARRVVGLVMGADTLLLTGLLYFSGGPSNPFSVFYLVHIALSAAVLSPGWTWTIVILADASFGLLFFHHVPLGGHLGHQGGGAAFSLHLQGMWVAFALASALIAGVVGRVTAELSAREQELGAARELAARNARLASLTTLAAGAAHELATPLNTIAVAAGELAAALDQRPGEAALAEDAHLIRAEVARCRGILEMMSGRSGESLGELPQALSVAALEAEIRERLEADLQGRLVVEGRSDALVAPRRALGQVLLGLVRNAAEASAPDQPVRLTVEEREGEVRIAVIDRGVGMSPEVLSRAGEPFFTTRSPGAGLGLGLFLARLLAERLGGRLTLRSAASQGTTVTLSLPRQPGPGRGP